MLSARGSTQRSAGRCCSGDRTGNREDVRRGWNASSRSRSNLEALAGVHEDGHLDDDRRIRERIRGSLYHGRVVHALLGTPEAVSNLPTLQADRTQRHLADLRRRGARGRRRKAASDGRRDVDGGIASAANGLEKIVSLRLPGDGAALVRGNGVEWIGRSGKVAAQQGCAVARIVDLAGDLGVWELAICPVGVAAPVGAWRQPGGSRGGAAVGLASLVGQRRSLMASRHVVAQPCGGSFRHVARANCRPSRHG